MENKNPNYSLELIVIASFLGGILYALVLIAGELKHIAEYLKPLL